MPVALSTASAYPVPAEGAFAIASALGYDGVEVMVWTDPVSQSAEALAALAREWEIPVVAVHMPCLLVTQRVWSVDPWVKLRRSIAMAEELGAGVVVVHPPFRWQREYALRFVDAVEVLGARTDVRLAVENMYPIAGRAARARLSAYAPHWDVTQLATPHATLDVSHAAAARQPLLDLAQQIGDRLAHVHLSDSLGSTKDEHLVPGRGVQPAADLLQHLATSRYGGHVVVEVNTRRAETPAQREADLAEALQFARTHLERPAPAPRA